MGYKIFWDTNCIIDIQENREDNLKYVIDVNEKVSQDSTFISALTVVNVHYISKPTNMEAFRDLVLSYRIVDLDAEIIEKAFSLKMKDFEDAVQLASAMSVNADYLLTWNTKDYKKIKSRVKVMTPKQYLKLL